MLLRSEADQLLQPQFLTAVFLQSSASFIILDIFLVQDYYMYSFPSFNFMFAS